VHDEAGIGIPVFITLLDLIRNSSRAAPDPARRHDGYNFAGNVWLDA